MSAMSDIDAANNDNYLGIVVVNAQNDTIVDSMLTVVY